MIYFGILMYKYLLTLENIFLLSEVSSMMANNMLKSRHPN
jgi:hypothetical protein